METHTETTKPTPKLTEPQRRALAAIATSGYVFPSLNYSWYHAGSVKVPYDMVQRLRRAGLVVARAVGPGKAYPDGRINGYRVTSHIIVPTDAGRELVNG